MAPQTNIPTAATVLGTIGTVCWCIQLLPQLYTNQRTRNTTGLPSSMMLLWAISASPLGAYAIIQSFNLPVQIQPQIFGALSLAVWVQIQVFSHAWRAWHAVAVALMIAAVLGGAQVALVLPLRGVYERGTEWPVTLVGVVAAVLLASGLLPPYWEIWKRRGRVVGINPLFLFTDWLGAVFSLMSLVVQRHFDVLGGVQYAVCAGLETGIFAIWGWWLFWHRRETKDAKAAGLDYNEYMRQKRIDEGKVDDLQEEVDGDGSGKV